MKQQLNKEFPVEQLSRKQIELFIKEWNVKFPYDRLWRNKYNIPFRSKAHLEASQIDIYLDIIEDLLVNKIRIEHKELLKNKEDYFKNGTLFKESNLTPEEEEKLFKNIRFPNSKNV